MEDMSVKDLDEAVKNLPQAPSIHLRLKLATRDEHNGVDLALSRFNLADADDYAAFLDLNHSALTALRPHWRSEDEADFTGVVDALATDLIDLGIEPSTEADPLFSPIDGLGLSYVIRGSRLGSKILRKTGRVRVPNRLFRFSDGDAVGVPSGPD